MPEITKNSNAVFKMTTFYTTPEKVVSLMRLTGNDGYRLLLTETSDPTRTEVEQWINQSEAIIEKRTNHAWKTKTVTDELHALVPPCDMIYPRETSICLYNRSVSSLDALYIFDGKTETDWKTTKTEGRANDYWVDYKLGIIHLRGWIWYYGDNALRISYKFGDTSVPGDVERACTLLTAITWIQNDFSRSMVPDGLSQQPSKSELIQLWKDEADQILKDHTTFLTVLR